MFQTVTQISQRIIATDTGIGGELYSFLGAETLITRAAESESIKSRRLRLRLLDYVNPDLHLDFRENLQGRNHLHSLWVFVGRNSNSRIFYFGFCEFCAAFPL